MGDVQQRRHHTEYRSSTGRLADLLVLALRVDAQQQPKLAHWLCPHKGCARTLHRKSVYISIVYGVYNIIPFV